MNSEITINDFSQHLFSNVNRNSFDLEKGTNGVQSTSFQSQPNRKLYQTNRTFATCFF